MPRLRRSEKTERWRYKNVVAMRLKFCRKWVFPTFGKGKTKRGGGTPRGAKKNGVAVTFL